MGDWWVKIINAVLILLNQNISFQQRGFWIIDLLNNSVQMRYSNCTLLQYVGISPLP